MAERRPRLLLATCGEFAGGGDEATLPELFAERGVDAAWAVWDDPAVPWGDAELVAIRMTWDYPAKLDAFVSWTRVVGGRTRLVNDARVVRWNIDKRYLADLREWGIPIVPTVIVEPDDRQLAAALASYPSAVVKPVVGVGGDGAFVWSEGDAVPVLEAPQLVQPFVASVRDVGEQSVYVIDGRAVAQIVKRPGVGEFRAHTHRGGTFERTDLDAAAAGLAGSTVALVSGRFGVDLPYARVDLLWLDGRWVVSELELIEPGLNYHVEPAIATAYVDAMLDALGATEVQP